MACDGCRWNFPRVMASDGRYHAVPLSKSRSGRRWIAGGRLGEAPVELMDCTAQVLPLLRIVAPGFVAGIVPEGGGCAPILRKLRGRDSAWRPVSIDMFLWSEAKIRAFCARRRWGVEVVG